LKWIITSVLFFMFFIIDKFQRKRIAAKYRDAQKIYVPMLRYQLAILFYVIAIIGSYFLIGDIYKDKVTNDSFFLLGVIICCTIYGSVHLFKRPMIVLNQNNVQIIKFIKIVEKKCSTFRFEKGKFLFHKVHIDNEVIGVFGKYYKLKLRS